MSIVTCPFHPNRQLMDNGFCRDCNDYPKSIKIAEPKGIVSGKWIIMCPNCGFGMKRRKFDSYATVTQKTRCLKCKEEIRYRVKSDEPLVKSVK